MIKLIKKAAEAFSRPLNWIKEKTKKPSEYLEKGRTGGLIMDILLTVQFLYGGFMESLYGNMNFGIGLLVTILPTLLIFELLYGLTRIILGRIKRSRVYFIITWILVWLVNITATKFTCFFSSLLMCLLLVISAEILGRCLWTVVSSGKWKNAATFTAMGLAMMYLLAFAFFFKNDSFGTGRVEHYLGMNNDVHLNTSQSDGFGDYLEKGDRSVGFMTYGPAECDLTTNTVNLSQYEKRTAPLMKLSEVFSNYEIDKAPLAGAIWYPDGAKDCPVFFMVHGAHNANTPSYMGYEYLGEYLASNGYVVVSVDENIVNSLDSGNNVRAILLLENMKAVLDMNADEKSPIYGLIDADRIAAGGHSRGGEMVATAYLYNDLDAYPDNGSIRLNYHFNISALVAIAPTVDQYMPAGHAVAIEDVDYLLIHGSSDQDVSSIMGEKQYNNVSFSDKKGRNHYKTSVYILGANHGQFNSEWGKYDLTPGMNGYLSTSDFISEQEQQLIAKAYIRSFLDRSLLNKSDYADLLVDNSDYLDYLPETVYITNYMDSDYKLLCDFDENVDLYRGYEEGSRVWCRGMTLWRTRMLEYGSGKEDENYVLECNWSEGSNPITEITIPETDLEKQLISFRIADKREKTEKETEGIQYRVELTDRNGNLAACDNPVYIYPTFALQLYKQDILFGSYEYKYQMQTVRLNRQMFEADDDFDFASVCKLCIVFDGNGDGKVIIDDVATSIK